MQWHNERNQRCTLEGEHKPHVFGSMDRHNPCGGGQTRVDRDADRRRWDHRSRPGDEQAATALLPAELPHPLPAQTAAIIASCMPERCHRGSNGSSTRPRNSRHESKSTSGAVRLPCEQAANQREV